MIWNKIRILCFLDNKTIYTHTIYSALQILLKLYLPTYMFNTSTNEQVQLKYVYNIYTQMWPRVQ